MKVLPRNIFLTGDAKAVLAGLLPESVDCVITSPPYPGGVRDYGRPDQLGREATAEGYVGNLRTVLRAVRAVLKPAGSLWLNLGDTYVRKRGGGVPSGSLHLAPQRVALALVADGWIVRNVCVWHKPNPLPQSATDRLSPTYEVVIFATKQRRYFFDLDAVRIPHRSAGKPSARGAAQRYQGGNAGLAQLKADGRVGNVRGKNPGDVWTLATAIDRLGHQATFPESLVELPLLATCPERICVQCDRAWTRPTRIVAVHGPDGRARTVRKVGALLRCGCFAPTRSGVVLDPFAGTGTVAKVAERLDRDWLGIELNQHYVELAKRRLGARSPEGGMSGGGLGGGRKDFGLSARRISQPLPQGGTS